MTAPNHPTYGAQPDSTQPDFERLREKRNAKVRQSIDDLCAKHGWDKDKVVSTFNPDACYCACPEGPCEHDWKGLREFDDGLGNEAVCTRCGTGAMAHDMRVAP